MFNTYKKTPEYVKAVQFTEESREEVLAWFNERRKVNEVGEDFFCFVGLIVSITATVTYGDWVVEGPRGISIYNQGDFVNFFEQTEDCIFADGLVAGEKEFESSAGVSLEEIKAGLGIE